MTGRNNSMRMPSQLEEELEGKVKNNSPAPIVNNQRDLLAFSVPTTLVDLPSKGLFYPEDHPLHERGTLEIKFMTAKEEDILTSDSLIKKNLAIDRLIQSLIIDKSIDAGSLLVGDRSAVVLEARKTAYGSDYKVEFSCTGCEEKNSHVFDLDFFLPKQVDYEDSDSFFVNERRNIVVRLPATGLTVELRMLTGDEEKAASERMKKKKKVRKDNLVTNQLKLIVVSVEGVEDYVAIHKFIDNMPARDSKFIRNFYEMVRPEIDMKQEYICEMCGNIADLEVPLSKEFFWPE